MSDYTASSKTQIIKPERWYIADSRSGKLILDQPSVGFESDKAAAFYLRAVGPHVMNDHWTVVEGSAVIG